METLKRKLRLYRGWLLVNLECFYMENKLRAMRFYISALEAMVRLMRRIGDGEDG